MVNTFEQDIAVTKVRERYLKQRIETMLGMQADKSDMHQEFQGIDFTVNGKSVDLKWTTVCRPTYAVEISYLNAIGSEKIGWFMDERHQTDVCLFVECDHKSQELNVFSFDLRELRQRVFQTKPADQILQQMSEMKQHNVTKSLVGSNGMKLVYSSFLKEQPVNLVIPKRSYRRLSSYRDCGSWFGGISDYELFLKNEGISF